MTDEIQKFNESLEKEQGEDRWKVIEGKQIPNMTLEEAKFQVEYLIPKEAISILLGHPGSCKTWLLLEIGKAVSTGNPLFGKFKTIQAKVLYIDEESPVIEIQRRWNLLLKKLEKELDSLDFLPMAGFRIDIPESRESLLDFVKKRGYTFLIFDSFRDLHALNENSSQEAQELINGFRQFTRNGITVLISHHQRKDFFLSSKDPNQAIRGSSGILAGIDSLIGIESKKQAEEKIEIRLTQSKLRQGKSLGPIQVNLLEEDGQLKFEYGGEIETETTKLENTKEAIKKLLEQNGQMYQAEIIETLVPQYFAPKTITRAIKDLKENKEIQPKPGEGRKIYYSMKEESD